jgi:L-fuconolactonase
MIITDAQVHIWAPETPERPWSQHGKTHAHRAVPLGKDELIREMTAAGVQRAVLVPPSFEGDRNDLVLEATRMHPERFAAMGRVPVERPENRELLRTWKDQPGMLGVRMTFHKEPHRTWLLEGKLDWFWEAAEQCEIPVMVFAPGVIPKIAEIAARHPRLRLVMDHLALALDVRDAAITEALAPVFTLARHSNVAVKTSALPKYVTEPYPFPSLHPHIRRIVDAFGPQRVFWGSDFTGLQCTYRQAVTLFTEELAFLSQADKEWIMGRGIVTWLNWKRAPG